MTYPLTSSPIVRLRIEPDVPADLYKEGPPALTGRRHGSRQPFPDATVQRARHLIETTTLTHQKIAERIGVKRSTISVWQKNYGWTRPLLAPRCPSVVPLWRAGPALKLRLLTGRLVAIAERMVSELETDRNTDLEKLVRALQVIKMARATVGGNRRRKFIIGPARTGLQMLTEEQAIRAALKELQRGGVDFDHAPQEALDLVIEANTPAEPDHPWLHAPKRGRRRQNRAMPKPASILAVDLKTEVET